jgi:hypothetical protein
LEHRYLEVVENHMKKLIKIIALFVLITTTGVAQFGKNKVQYDTFKWSFLQTKILMSIFTLVVKLWPNLPRRSEKQALKDICKVLNRRLRKRVTLVVYNSHSDFQQTNVTLSYLSEGIGGFTELSKTERWSRSTGRITISGM